MTREEIEKTLKTMTRDQLVLVCHLVGLGDDSYHWYSRAHYHWRSKNEIIRNILDSRHVTKYLHA